MRASNRKPQPHQAAFKVIRSDEDKRHGEVSFKVKEESEKRDRGCHICG